MSEIIIGKHTLESLTSGMYSDSFVVFREYIQNAADSIDAAYSNHVLSSGDDRITICLSPSERQIVIEDNGLGIASDIAEKHLLVLETHAKNLTVIAVSEA